MNTERICAMCGVLCDDPDMFNINGTDYCSEGCYRSVKVLPTGYFASAEGQICRECDVQGYDNEMLFCEGCEVWVCEACAFMHAAHMEETSRA